MTNRIDGQKLERMLANGYANLCLHEEKINDLNVFPVADGDTGVNMRLTVEKGLETAAALGYATVEFAGFFGRPADSVKATLERLGLRASGTHTGIEALTPDRIAETMGYHLALGCRDLIIPGYPHADTPEGLDELLRTVE